MENVLEIENVSDIELSHGYKESQIVDLTYILS